MTSTQNLLNDTIAKLETLPSRSCKSVMKANDLKRAQTDSVDDMRSKIVSAFSAKPQDFRIPADLDRHEDIWSAVRELIAAISLPSTEPAYRVVNEAGENMTKPVKLERAKTHAKNLATKNPGETFRVIDEASGASESDHMVEPVEDEEGKDDDDERPADLRGHLCKQAEVLCALAIEARDRALGAAKLEALAADPSATQTPNITAVIARRVVETEWENRLWQRAREEQAAYLERKTRREGTQTRDRDPRLPAAGTVLERPYKGTTYRVRVEADGSATLLQANGNSGSGYKSLSGIAKALTGHQQNGYRWFGLDTSNDDGAGAGTSTTEE